jgi:hypothetical protein
MRLDRRPDLGARSSGITDVHVTRIVSRNGLDREPRPHRRSATRGRAPRRLRVRALRAGVRENEVLARARRSSWCCERLVSNTGSLEGKSTSADRTRSRGARLRAMRWKRSPSDEPCSRTIRSMRGTTVDGIRGDHRYASHQSLRRSLRRANQRQSGYEINSTRTQTKYVSRSV